MKILYGVVGEGMGHATRSHTILNHLVKDHDVEIVASGKAYEYLPRFFTNVHRIEGYGFEFDGNSISVYESFRKLIRDIPTKGPANIRRYLEMVKKDKPDVVISDFESFAYSVAKYHQTPIISIDNMQIINRCSIDVPGDSKEEYRLAKGVVKGKLPGCYHYMVTTFFYPDIKKKDTSLYPPILRDKVLDTIPSDGRHILVYQTAAQGDGLLDILGAMDEDFVVYGFNKDEDLGNVQLRDFSEKGFIDDLASSKGVIANAGFSLMGEAVYLGKPFYAIPLARQFEQILNGHYLSKMGYGESHADLTKDKVDGFLSNIGIYQDNLKCHKQERNSKILSSLDGHLDKVANGEWNR